MPRKVVVAIKVASYSTSLSIVMLVSSAATVTNPNVLYEWTILEHTALPLVVVGIYRL